MSDVVSLHVNGKEYGGWKSARVTRGIESVAGSFDLEVSDRWESGARPWPIVEEDECKILIGTTVLITGYVDKRTLSYGPEDHSLKVSGRDKTGALVDCSAVLNHWEFKNVAVLTLAKRVTEPFSIPVSLQAGVVLPRPPAKLSIDPGESAFEAIEKACRPAALLPISDGHGGLVLSRTGSTVCGTALVEGENILSASAEYDASGRFRNYIVKGQHQGSNDFFGKPASSIKGTAEDQNVRRTERTLLVHHEGLTTVESAKKRAQWEATVRAARADAVTITVQGWRQTNGALWPINSLVSVNSPLLGIKGDMLITEATYSLDSSGTTTQLKLKNPDAFKPEPVIAKANNHWKEIVKGV